MSSSTNEKKRLANLRHKNYRERRKRSKLCEDEIPEKHDTETTDEILAEDIEKNLNVCEDSDKPVVIDTSHQIQDKEVIESDQTDQIDWEELKNSILDSRFSSDESDEEDRSDNESEATECENENDSEIGIKLKEWAIEYSIPYTHLDGLLKVLKPFHPELPLTSKTLLKRRNKSEKYKIEKFNPADTTDKSEFVHLGIAEQLQRTVNPVLHKSTVLDLQFNIDGLPLYHSSQKEFWPILGKVYTENNLYKPFAISVYCGDGKPKNVQRYLHNFIEDLNHLLAAGLDIGEKHFTIKVMCFICDKPARSYIKCIKGHTGFYACERCSVQGYRKDNRTVFPIDEGVRRTDHSFRNYINSEHHLSESPLLSIVPPIDMIGDFVLDFMHLCCLGVMKKLLTEYWMKCTISHLKREDIFRISVRMMNLSKQVPYEFQRTTRSLGEIGKWKATEYRFFLLYCGMFVLKGVLPREMYQHFLLLSIASRIISCRNLYTLYVDHAQIYFERFVKLCAILYGEKSQILNVHSLIHIVDDVKKFHCPVSDISAFPFESTLGQLKKYIRGGKKPLTQLCNRLEEQQSFSKNKVSEPTIFKILSSKKSKDSVVIHKIQFKNCQLSTKSPNNIVMLKNNDILQITRMDCTERSDSYEKVYITGKKIPIIQSGLDYPSDSRNLKIFKIELSKSDTIIKTLLCNVDCKLVALTIQELSEDPEESYAMPLLHMDYNF